MHTDTKSSFGSGRPLPFFSAIRELADMGVVDPPPVPAARALEHITYWYIRDSETLVAALRHTAEKLAAARKENGVLRERNAVLEARAATLQASVFLNYALTMALLAVGVIWMGR